MTNEQLKVIADKHLPDGYGHCEHCPQLWPCDASQLLDHVQLLVTKLLEACSKQAVLEQNACDLAESYRTSQPITAPEAEVGT